MIVWDFMYDEHFGYIEQWIDVVHRIWFFFIPCVLLVGGPIQGNNNEFKHFLYCIFFFLKDFYYNYYHV